MEELECVKLIKPFKDLVVGIKGCIVLKYNDEDYEVEFFDENDDSFGVYTISKEYIEVF